MTFDELCIVTDTGILGSSLMVVLIFLLDFIWFIWTRLEDCGDETVGEEISSTASTGLDVEGDAYENRGTALSLKAKGSGVALVEVHKEESAKEPGSTSLLRAIPTPLSDLRYAT